MRMFRFSAPAVLLLAMVAPALAQSDDCAELKAVVAAAVKNPIGAPTTLPLLGATCNGIQHGYPTCTWTTGLADPDSDYRLVVEKVSACFPGSQIAEYQIASTAGVGTIVNLPTGQTIHVDDNRSLHGVALDVTPAP